METLSKSNFHTTILRRKEGSNAKKSQNFFYYLAWPILGLISQSKLKRNIMYLDMTNEDSNTRSTSRSTFTLLRFPVTLLDPVLLMQSFDNWMLPPGGGTPYNGLYGEAPPERGAFFRLQVYKRVGISQVEVYLKG